jgi:hypothetical protein
MLLILSFIRYNFFGLKVLTLSIPKMLQFLRLERVNTFKPPKTVAYKNRIKSMMPNGITGLERVKPWH